MANGDPVPQIDNRTEYQYLLPQDIIARVIYSEAQGESYQGKQAVHYVIVNRLLLDMGEFGHSTWEICTNPVNSFDGMKTTAAHAPTTSSQAWQDSIYIAITNTTNPIGHCLWFNRNDVFKNNCNAAMTEYKFPGTSIYKKIVEKYVIGNQTFFRVEGSTYVW
jgi:hypothetical protein